jgi:hypothetical protein
VAHCFINFIGFINAKGDDMGLIGAMFGWDKSMGANNAVLASHLLENISEDLKLEITNQIILIIRSVYPRMTEEQALLDLNKASRIAQLNFVALACDNLGIPPLIKKNAWTRIKNPHAVARDIDIDKINAAIASVLMQDRVQINWPGNNVKINFTGKSHANLNKGSKNLTKLEIAENITILSNNIVSNSGVDVLCNGFFVLKNNFSVHFIENRIKILTDTVAIAEVKKTPQYSELSELIIIGKIDMPELIDHLINPLSLSIIHDFSTQSNEFDRLELGSFF